MKPFRYLRDPLFLACLAVYFVNRLVIKPYLPNTFSQCYLNDLVCIPFWIPIMLFAMRKAGLRRDDGPPRSYEIIVPLLVWSLAFEVVAPYTNTLDGLAFGDHVDILCYVTGALIAATFWGSWYEERSQVQSPRPNEDPGAL